MKNEYFANPSNNSSNGKRPTKWSRNRPQQHGNFLNNREKTLICKSKIQVNESQKDEKEHQQWVLDSGAGNHMCHEKDFFFNLRKVNVQIGTAGEETLKAEYIGDIRTEFSDGRQLCRGTLHDVLYVPGLKGRYN